MRKVAIRNKMKLMNANSRRILESIIIEAIIDMNHKDYICKDMLERIVLMYLSLFGNRDYIEVEDLTKYEISIIGWKGIINIYLKEEYLEPKNRNIKMLVIDELIEFISLMSELQIVAVRVLVIKSIQDYLNNGKVRELV